MKCPRCGHDVYYVTDSKPEVRECARCHAEWEIPGRQRPARVLE